MDQVTIFLTPLHPSISLGERKIILDKDNTEIQVGRASKSAAKGLVGLAGNAWFESPVMSREHAKLVFNPAKMTLMIQDIGSMHGTYHTRTITTTRLGNNDTKELSIGDVLIFGAEVKRGPEVFPACSFRVNFVFSQQKPTNTFHVPDFSSDVGEEYGTDGADDSASEDEIPSLVSFEAHSKTPSSAVRSAQSSEHVVITNNPAAPVPSTPAFFNNKTPIIYIDTDEEDEEEDDVEVLISDEGSVSSDSDGPSEAGDSDNSDDSNENSVGMSDSIALFPTDQAEWSSSSSSDNEDEEQISEDEHELAAGDIESDDNRSDYSLSDAGREGIRALFDGGLLGRDGSPDLGEDESCTSPARSSSKPTDLSEFSEIQTELDSDIAGLQRKLQTPPKLQPADVIQWEPRQPSPSDAAMVKPTTSELEQIRKSAFFEARRHNKARLEAERSDITYPRSDGNIESRSLPPPVSQPEAWVPRRPEVVSSQFKWVTMPQTLPETGKWHIGGRSNVSFVESSTNASPEPNMTSAVKFNESKALLAASAKLSLPLVFNPPTRPTLSGRSGLTINDIIEAPKNNKRKAEEISADAGDAVPVAEPKSVEVVNVVKSRPIKRMKRFAECLGYAALGGAAVGAGIVSVLIATAPDFL